MRITIAGRTFYPDEFLILMWLVIGFFVGIVCFAVISARDETKYIRGSAGTSCAHWIQECALHRSLVDCLADAYALGCRQ